MLDIWCIYLVIWYEDSVYRYHAGGISFNSSRYGHFYVCCMFWKEYKFSVAFLLGSLRDSKGILTCPHVHTTSHNTYHILDRWEHAEHIRHCWYSQFRGSSVTVVGFFQSFCNWHSVLNLRNEKIMFLRELYKINLKSFIFSFQTVQTASSVWEMCRDLEAIESWNQKYRPSHRCPHTIYPFMWNKLVSSIGALYRRYLQNSTWVNICIFYTYMYGKKEKGYWCQYYIFFKMY